MMTSIGTNACNFLESLISNIFGSDGRNVSTQFRNLQVHMAKVFRAQFLQDSSISVTLMNITGDILCCYQTQSETLQDFEMELVNPKGPIFHHLCGVTLLDFYTKAAPCHELDLSLQISKFLLEELVFKQANLEISLKKFPDTGKFLEAMRDNKFLPSSKSYQGAWTAAKTREVPMYNARALVKEALDGLETHSKSCEFVDIFGHLTSRWNMMSLPLLQSHLHDFTWIPLPFSS